jgi:hypothetical protein
VITQLAGSDIEHDHLVPVLAVVEPTGLRLRIADGSGGLFDCVVPDEACRVLWVGEAIQPEQFAEVLDMLLSDEDRGFLDGVVGAAVASWIQVEAP